MAHIALPEGAPGIRGPMAFRPETAKPLNELVDVLLRGPHLLSPGERELIATLQWMPSPAPGMKLGDNAQPLAAFLHVY